MIIFLYAMYIHYYIGIYKYTYLYYDYIYCRFPLQKIEIPNIEIGTKDPRILLLLAVPLRIFLAIFSS